MAQDEKVIARLIVSKSKELIASAGVKIDELKKARGFVACIKTAALVLPEIVRSIEEASKQVAGVLPGKDKRDVAIELLLEYVKLPWYVPEPVVRVILGWAIDKAVVELNKRIGKVWPVTPKAEDHS